MEKSLGAVAGTALLRHNSFLTDSPSPPNLVYRVPNESIN